MAKSLESGKENRGNTIRNPSIGRIKNCFEIRVPVRLPNAVKTGDDDLMRFRVTGCRINPSFNQLNDVAYGYFMNPGSEDINGRKNFKHPKGLNVLIFSQLPTFFASLIKGSQPSSSPSRAKAPKYASTGNISIRSTPNMAPHTSGILRTVKNANMPPI